MIYVFWWNTPLNINHPVWVFQKSGESEPSEMQSQSSSEVQKLSWKSVFDGLVMIFGFITGNLDGDVNLSHEDRVPRFWANSTGNNFRTTNIIMLGVGICFGAIHCIAWGFSFPMHTELLIWWVSSVATTAVPIYISLMITLGAWLKNMDFCTIRDIAVFSLIPVGLLYVKARVVTLVLALTSLRDLPPGAFNTVHWTTFIPMYNLLLHYLWLASHSPNTCTWSHQLNSMPSALNYSTSKYRHLLLSLTPPQYHSNKHKTYSEVMCFTLCIAMDVAFLIL